MDHITDLLQRSTSDESPGVEAMASLDPSLVAIERHRATWAAYNEIVRHEPDDDDPKLKDASDADWRAWDDVCRVLPTTLIGAATMASYVERHASNCLYTMDNGPSAALVAISAAVAYIDRRDRRSTCTEPSCDGPSLNRLIDAHRRADNILNDSLYADGKLQAGAAGWCSMKTIRAEIEERRAFHALLAWRPVTIAENAERLRYLLTDRCGPWRDSRPEERELEIFFASLMGADI